MSIGIPDTKLLWGRAGGLCSICRLKLSEDKQRSNEAFPFGEQAHIVAEDPSGPRGNSPLTQEERNSYSNLILVCPNCHTKIDKDLVTYPVEVLHRYKTRHELWLEESRVSWGDRLKNANDFIYARIVDAAAELCMFEHWEEWTGAAISVNPAWRKEWMDSVEEFRRRIIRVVWPATMPELERALVTLSLNLVMALESFGKHCEMREDGWFREVRFYKSSGWNPNYEDDVAAYNKWIKEQDKSIFDATKSANWVAEVVRRELNPMFFAVPGKFVVTVGPDPIGNYVTRVLEYSDEEKGAEPSAVELKHKAARDAKRELTREFDEE